MTGGVRPNLFQMSSQVLALLEPELAADGLEVLDVRVFQGGGRVQVRIYVDLKDSTETGVGINIGQCARAGRSVNMLMEEADLFAGEYVLEVSSPGIRRPLRLARHYEAVVGEKIDLKVRLGSKSRRVRGELVSFVENVATIRKPAAATSAADDGNEEVAEVDLLEKVPLGQILEANLDPDFDAKALINAARRRKKEERRESRIAKKKPKKGRPKKSQND